MLVRLLQRFACFDLAQEESNPSAVPPPGYAKTRGTNGQDKVRIRSHLTLFVEVRLHHNPPSTQQYSLQSREVCGFGCAMQKRLNKIILGPLRVSMLHLPLP